MNLSKLFFWIKKRGNANRVSVPSYKFDQKLIKKTGSTIFPKWSQLRYLGNFLSRSEKKIVTTGLIIFFVSALAAGSIWLLQNQTVVPDRGGDYTEAMVGQPKYVNPLFASTNDVDTDLASLIYSGLFKYNNKQELVPDLATSYTVSTDGRIYDIQLREDVQWSDGEPLTASDIVFTFQTIQDPEIGSPLLTTFQDVEITQTGDFSIRFTRKEPFAPFLGSLTVGILPQHIWITVPPSGIRLAKNNLQPVGSGPWQFDKMTKQDSTGFIESYTLVPNEHYYEHKPYLNKLVFQYYFSYSEVAIALRSKSVMASSFLPNDLTDKIVGKNFQLHQFKLPQYTALFFNQDSIAVLKDANFRLALNLALDKNKILKDGLGDRGQVTNSPILTESEPSSSSTFPGFDPSKADELLSKSWTKIQPEDFYTLEYEATIKEKQSFFDEIKNNTTTPAEEREAQIKKLEEEISSMVRESMNPNQSYYRKNKNNEILSLMITTVETSEYQAVAEAIANMWRALGIKTDVEIIGSSQISRDVLRSRDYEILLYGEIVGADPDPYPFWHSSQIAYPGLNLSLFVNRAADKLLEDARATTTASVRIDNYKKFQDILAKEIPAVFLYTPTYNFVVSKDIKGVNLQNIIAPADRFNDLNNWYIKTKHQWKD